MPAIAITICAKLHETSLVVEEQNNPSVCQEQSSALFVILAWPGGGQLVNLAAKAMIVGPKIEKQKSRIDDA